MQDFNITILCSHTINWRCLLGWENNERGAQTSALTQPLSSEGHGISHSETAPTCPLCRFYQSPQELSRCDDCGVTDNFFEQVRVQRDASFKSNQKELL